MFVTDDPTSPAIFHFFAGHMEQSVIDVEDVAPPLLSLDLNFLLLLRKSSVCSFKSDINDLCTYAVEKKLF